MGSSSSKLDSLTQITLGAAAGELVLGRKIGNRAFLWGGFAGTIPDLDVLANLVTDPLSALAYHRAFTHSLLFALLAAPILGALVYRLYGGVGRLLSARWPFGLLLLAGLSLLWLLLFIGSSLMPLPINGIGRITLMVAVTTTAFIGCIYLIRRWRNLQLPTESKASWWEWTLLFFWAIVTHPLLDSCTVFGTQLLQPFVADRFAISSISVIDPLYTGPFLLFLLIVARLRPRSPGRRYFNRLAWLCSLTYLFLTWVNQASVNSVLEHSLRSEQITTRRQMVSPTLGNNILWQGVAEADSFFYYGKYSLFDERPLFDIQQIPKNHQLIANHWEDRDITLLRWFSGGYFGVLALPNGQIQINDLRYGGLPNRLRYPRDYLFHWKLEKQEGKLCVVSSSSIQDQSLSCILQQVVTRLLGN